MKNILIISDEDKLKAWKRAMRDANISLGLNGRTKTSVYKNKKAYDRKRDKIVSF